MIVNTLRRVGRGLPSVRLLVEYMMIGALVALVAHAVLAWSERSQLAQRAAQLEGQLATVESTLDAQVAMNRDQDAAIARLRALREIDRQAIAGLHTDLNRITVRDRVLRQRITHLEHFHDEAKAFLDSDVPDVLGCLLDGGSCQASHRHTDPR
ncbi:hypothetical protein B9J09_07030 [Xylella fastidiosa subsp. pauca]|uniref:hypothetical protein n=2 Tax=Xylella fastidiosa TaxID=2371 RepID=UPI000582EFF4|nr:hypothetical protein [Xylella fastidiosa]ARO68710.1 hypothetical protein B9J09_06445 [Xylella fastidiosa subsp. pauca]ARO68811.1 hypothetical protein B9J09_07030 [Xylella fastidiosa subsp. pauca]AVI20793.1 hypothetical protein BCV75_05990 [Xylella fastidiosa]AVI20883.1 hypothetical protein BCV75_06545 [Xylella fastidiosa]AVI22827.1 hypothetical protein BC375_06050 [Xylella fastidiosa]